MLAMQDANEVGKSLLENGVDGIDKLKLMEVMLERKNNHMRDKVKRNEHILVRSEEEDKDGIDLQWNDLKKFTTVPEYVGMRILGPI